MGDHCLHLVCRAVTVCRGRPSTIAVNALRDLSTHTWKVGVFGEVQDNRVYCPGLTMTCHVARRWQEPGAHPVRTWRLQPLGDCPSAVGWRSGKEIDFPTLVQAHIFTLSWFPKVMQPTCTGLVSDRLDFESKSVLFQVLVTQSCLTLCDSMDSSPPGSSVCGISQARILVWVDISFSRGSSQPTN